jgi:hypothetical protein
MTDPIRLFAPVAALEVAACEPNDTAPDNGIEGRSRTT